MKSGGMNIISPKKKAVSFLRRLVRFSSPVTLKPMNMQNQKSMNSTPILIKEGYWMNSQLSVARFYGGIKFNGEEYVIVPPKNDLLMIKWVPVYKALGRERTVNLIMSGTSLEVAKKMIKAKDDVEQLKLDL